MDSYNQNFAIWNKVAAAYQEKFMDLDLYNDTYDIFCSLITKPNATVFEIGCGPGNVTRHLLSQRPDFKIEAIDMAPNMIALAQKNNPNATFRLMDAREINKLSQKFDAILCGFCMPYLSKADAAKLIKDCACLLNSGGIFYLSTIEGDYDSSGLETSSTGDHMYVYYHEASYLQEELTANNFKLVNLIRKPYPKADKLSAIHLIFIATKIQ